MLRVSKKILTSFKCGSYLVRLRNSDIMRMSSLLESIAKYIPCEFARKPRTLTELPRWKATEFRQFLLYTGPVVLQGKVTPKIFNHFMLLHVAMRILLTPLICDEHNALANDLLHKFVQQAPSLFGEEFMSYNVHCLIHLAMDAKRYGHLDRVSAFPFENMLKNIKNMLRKPGAKLVQVINRCFENEYHF